MELAHRTLEVALLVVDGEHDVDRAGGAGGRERSARRRGLVHWANGRRARLAPAPVFLGVRRELRCRTLPRERLQATPGGTVLSKFDDYPIHQTSQPIAQPATGDRNAYDRYWFNGYQDDGEFYFGIGAALVPEPRDPRLRVQHRARR